MTPIRRAGDRIGREAARVRRHRRFLKYRKDPRTATGILATASALALVAILWFGRGTTFSGDESSWVAVTPQIDLEVIFTPHGGHLVALSRLIYWPLLEMFGTAYLPFRLLSAAAVLVSVWLLYLYGRRRTDHFVALAPCLVLLFFGADFLHLFQGNGFTVVSSLAFGLAALLSFDRDDRRGDVLACLWLTAGVFAYSTILPFVVAIAALVLLGSDRWKRIWIPLVPAAVYLAWRIWLLAADVGSTGGGFDPVNLLLVPAWTFQSISGILNSLTGLSFDFAGGSATNPVGLAGPPLAILFIVLTGWRISRKSLNGALLAALVLALSLFALQAVASTGSGTRLPGSDTRYLFPGAFAVILIAFELARSWKPSPRGLLALAVVTCCGLAANVFLMKQNSVLVRESGYQIRSLAGAMKLGIESRPGSATPAEIRESIGTVKGSLAGMARQGYGAFGYGPDGLSAQPPSLRESVDLIYVTNSGVKLRSGGKVPDGCRTYAAGSDGVSRAQVAPGRVTLRSPASGAVSVGRFADAAGVSAGLLEAGVPAVLTLPSDSANLPWKVAVTTPELEVCADA